MPIWASIPSARSARAPRRAGRAGPRTPASRACRPRRRPGASTTSASRSAYPSATRVRAGEQLVEPAQLRDPDRAEDVGEPVVRRGLRRCPRASIEPVVAQAPDRGGQLLVVVVTAPPSPVVTILRGWNERQPIVPSPPHGIRASGRRARRRRPRAAASPAGPRLERLQSSGRPKRCTARTAFVRGVTAS